MVNPDITYLTNHDPERGNRLEFIQTTPEHPFYLAGSVDGSTHPQPEGYIDLSSNWVGTGYLKVGDKVRQEDGSVGTVENVISYQ